MEIIFNAKELAAAVGAVSSIVTGKSTLPGITGIHIDASDSGVTVSANSLDMGMRYTIGAQVLTSGKTLVSGKLFADLIRRLPGPDISLKLDAESNVLIVTCGAAKYKILTMDVYTFPAVDVAKATNSIELNTDVLKNIYGMTAFAVGDGKDKPYFSGIHISLQNGKMSAVGTNSHRLARKQIPFEAGAGEFIIPPAALGIMTKLIDSETAKLSWNSGRVWIETENLYIVSRLIDGRFPDVNRVIPQTVTTTVCVDRKQFRQAIERLELVGLQRMEKFSVFTLKLSVTENLLTLSTESRDKGQAKEELAVITAGEPIDICFSGGYFTDCLDVLASEQVVLSLLNQSSPAMMTSEDDDSFVYVVTPLRMV